MRIQDRTNRRTTVVELSVGEFLLLAALAGWGVGIVIYGLSIV